MMDCEADESARNILHFTDESFVLGELGAELFDLTSLIWVNDASGLER